MNAFIAFVRKEFLDRQRSGRLTVLGILFVLFGIMDPAIAKLTPWLLEIMAEELANSGMTVGTVTITAMDSWVQFYKNIPMALIVFLCMEAGCFTKEYGSGSLIPLLTKGLPRRTVVLAKSLVLTLIFTAGYWVCYGITWGYNDWFWDNSVAQNLGFSAVCWWVFGLWTISLTVLFSSFSSSSTFVLLGTGGTVGASYILGLFPFAKEYVPTLLMDGNSLTYGLLEPTDYTSALAVTLVLTAAAFLGAIPIFDRKKL